MNDGWNKEKGVKISQKQTMLIERKIEVKQK